MATTLESLLAIRTTMLARLAVLEASNKVNYSLDGESYQWGQEKNDLLNRLEKIETMIASADGGWEVRSQGVF